MNQWINRIRKFNGITSFPPDSCAPFPRREPLFPCLRVRRTASFIRTLVHKTKGTPDSLLRPNRHHHNHLFDSTFHLVIIRLSVSSDNVCVLISFSFLFTSFDYMRLFWTLILKAIWNLYFFSLNSFVISFFPYFLISCPDRRLHSCLFCLIDNQTPCKRRSLT